jgi:hypothetical protein
MFRRAIWSGSVIGGGSGIERAGVCDALVGAVLVVEVFELA